MLQTYDERNRDLVVNVAGELTHRDRARVSPFDSAVQGGDAVWEGLRLYRGRIFRLTEHLTRLRDSARALDVPFDDAMLSWPPGPRDSDGVWAAHWYGSVHASTGFAPYRSPAEPLPARLEPLADSCMPYYLQLHLYRISAQGAANAADLR